MKNPTRGSAAKTEAAPVNAPAAATVTPSELPSSPTLKLPAPAAVPPPSPQKVNLGAEAVMINDMHESIARSDASNLKTAVEVGQHCLTVKAYLKEDGTWMKWVEDNLKFTSHTANSYIRVHEAHATGELKDVTTLSAAYVLLGITKNAPTGGGGGRDEGKAKCEFHARMDAEKLQGQITKIFADLKSIPTVVVQGVKLGERRESLSQALKAYKKILLQKGGVIVIPPTE